MEHLGVCFDSIYQRCPLLYQLSHGLEGIGQLKAHAHHVEAPEDQVLVGLLLWKPKLGVFLFHIQGMLQKVVVQQGIGAEPYQNVGHWHEEEDVLYDYDADRA